MDLLAGKQTSYEDQEFTGVNHVGQILAGILFQDCFFTNCNFSEAAFLNCEFHNCRFSQCNLSLVSVKNSQFKGIQFKDSKAIGINWAEASWPRLGGLESIDFTGCALNYASFFGLSLKGRELSGCTALEVDFAEADLTDANCTRTDFQKSRFLNTNLTCADFTNARNYMISPLLNKIKHAKFSLPEAMSLLYSLDIILVN